MPQYISEEQAKKLRVHLAEETKVSPLSEYLKEIIYGGNDGIVTTFAVVAGFAGAQKIGADPILPALTVLLFGIANLFSDGASMALGNFLSLRSEQDVYKSEKKKEIAEIRANKDMEKEETYEILVSRGFSHDHAKKITEIYSTNENYWAEFMMDKEIKLPNPENSNPFFTGLATFISFTIFGFIPLIPYIFFAGGATNDFITSAFFALLALVALGILRYQVTRLQIVRSIGEVVLVGCIAATIAFIVGLMFRG